MANQYNVTFTGVILSGFDKATVKPQVAQLLKLPPEKINAFFSGQSVTIKKNIELESALKIQSVLESKGLTIQITEDRPVSPIITDEPDEKPMFELVKDDPEPIPEAKPNPIHEQRKQRPALAAAATMGAANQIKRNPINNPQKKLTK